MTGFSDHCEGCPIYPHRVESSMVGIDSSHRKSSEDSTRVITTRTYWRSSDEGLSVKYIKDTSRE